MRTFELPGRSWQTLDQYLPRGVRIATWVITAVAAALIAGPTLYLVVWCFFGTDVIGRLRPFSDPTSRWVREVLTQDGWRASLAFSVVLGVSVSVIGAAVNSVYGYLSRFMPKWIDRLTFSVMVVVLMNPLIAYAMSLRFLGVALKWPEWLILGAGHLVVVLPLQFLIFEAARETVSREMLWAGRTLGASHWTNLFRVFVPNSKLALFGAFVVGFFVSFDEVVIAAFVQEGASMTVPVRLWRGLSHVVRPEAAVVAVLLLGGVVTAGAIRYWIATAEGRQRTRGLGEVAFGLWKETLAFCLAAAAVWLVVEPKATGPISWLIKGGISAGVGVLTSLLVGLWKARKPVTGLLKVANVERADLRTVPKCFSFGEVGVALKVAEALRGGGWVDMHQDAVNRLSKICFDRSRGRYIGTDRNVPSAYYKLYPEYLGAQLSRDFTRDDVRFVLYDAASLEADIRRYPDLARRFIRSHVAAGIVLLAVSWSDSSELAIASGLPSPDFGLFAGDYALFFEPPNSEPPHPDGPARVMLSHVDRELGDRIEVFLQQLVDRAHEVVPDHGFPVMRELTPETRNAYRVSMFRNRWRRNR